MVTVTHLLHVACAGDVHGAPTGEGTREWGRRRDHPTPGRSLAVSL